MTRHMVFCANSLFGYMDPWYKWYMDPWYEWYMDPWYKWFDSLTANCCVSQLLPLVLACFITEFKFCEMCDTQMGSFNAHLWCLTKVKCNSQAQTLSKENEPTRGTTVTCSPDSSG
jgi:hypothetical protein